MVLAVPAVAHAAPTATADFDGDGEADLAVGAPDSVAGRQHAGAVNVIYGSGSGGLPRGSASRGIKAGAEEDDRFGHAVAAGDFDGDDEDDRHQGLQQAFDNFGFDVAASGQPSSAPPINIEANAAHRDVDPGDVLPEAGAPDHVRQVEDAAGS